MYEDYLRQALDHAERSVFQHAFLAQPEPERSVRFPVPGEIDLRYDLPLSPFLRHALVQLYMPAAMRRLRLDEIHVSRAAARNTILIEARFRMDDIRRRRIEIGRGRSYELTYRSLEHLADDIMRIGPLLYARMVEDRVMHELVEAAELRLRELTDVTGTATEIRDAELRLAYLRDFRPRYYHGRLILEETAWTPIDPSGPIMPVSLLDDRIEIGVISEELLQSLGPVTANSFYYETVIDRIVDAPVRPAIRRPQTWAERVQKAHARGLKLLRRNLTPEQRASFDEHAYFDVIGGATGKRYRIHDGCQRNVYELGLSGKPICGFCFLPMGDLARGDIMLAQKNALELDEWKTRSIAIAFDDRRDWCRHDVQPSRTRLPRFQRFWEWLHRI
jgi:hypothetical protein